MEGKQTVEKENGRVRAHHISVFIRTFLILQYRYTGKMFKNSFYS